MGSSDGDEVKRRVHERRVAAGLPVRSPEEKQADMDRLYAQVRAHRLAELRHEQALTQKAVAASMGVSSPRVSAIETGDVDHVEVATLRSYVEALGGRLRVLADFGDTEYTVA